MVLSKIISQMGDIAVETRPLDAMRDIGSISLRRESIPMTAAYWLTHGNGTRFAFSDSVCGSELESFCSMYREMILNDRFTNLHGWRIDFTTDTITEVPIDEFVRTVDKLAAITGKNEERVTAENDSSLYLNSAYFAANNGELETFRSNQGKNHYCVQTLEYVIKGEDFDGSISQELAANYSIERIVFVTAATVYNSSASYDNDVVEWANRIIADIPPAVVEQVKDYPLRVEPNKIAEYVRNTLAPLEEAQANEDAPTEDVERF